MTTPFELTLTRPDDWHLHLRDGHAMAAVLPHSAKQFARAIVMPNLKPPVTDTAMALAYRERILAALPDTMQFEPLMTLYLTDRLSPEEIRHAAASGAVTAAKLYPAGATTNSDSGVTRIKAIYPTLEAMQAVDMPLLVHAEVTDPQIDIFDREQVFIERIMQRVVRDFPQLRVVFEHITTADAVAFVEQAPANIGATITAHHLLYNRNAMLVGGIRPHYYCLPVLKREEHRRELVRAATGGNPKFFLGTDSAPHPQNDKESACGCAGSYTAFAAIEMYAELFEQAGALDRLEAFAAFHGADFYGLPRNQEQVRLVREPWQVPETYGFGEGKVVPLGAGGQLNWRLV